MSQPILVIDDEKNLADLYKMILESEGFTVHVAYDGYEGIQKAKQIRPGLIISDMNMPNITGRELQLRLNQLDIPARFIMITGEQDRKLEKAVLKSSASDFFLKPIAPETLITQVKRALELSDPMRTSTNVKYYMDQLETANSRIEYLSDVNEKLKTTNKEMSEKINNKMTVDNEIIELNDRVFIVHGHDNQMKQHVARVVSKLGLKPVILHEQPNNGKTIIEKLVKHSKQSGYAIILLSPDDIAFNKSNPDNQKDRARQNVIFELGLFIGLIGRERVFAIVKNSGKFELPSDYLGVVYTKYDENGAWGFDLVRELKSLNYSVSADDII